MRTHLLVVAGAVLAMHTTGCFRYYEAEVSGYIRDSVSKDGLNEAVVRIYYEGANDDSYQQTFTQRLGDQSGYFVFRRVVWNTADPLFDDEGDLHDVRVTVEHEDYQTFDANVRVVSGAQNSVGDVYLDRAFFIAGSVEGHILDAERDHDGENPGINGLSVELYVPDVRIEDPAAARLWVETHNPDDIAVTQTNDTVAGFFGFNQVRFKVPGEVPAGDDERGTPWPILLRVDDPEFFELLTYGLSIASGEVASIIEDQNINKRHYSGDLEGRVTDYSNGDGINAVTVDVFVPDSAINSATELSAYVENNDPDLSTTSRANDDEDGHFNLANIAWEIDIEPTAEQEHQRQAVVVRTSAPDYAEQIIYRDPRATDYSPLVVLTSNNSFTMPNVQLRRTHFYGTFEGFVREVIGALESGRNGVTLKLYYDPDDPDLSELANFDPDHIEFSDQVTTGNTQNGDSVEAGFYRFTGINWDNLDGGALGNGKDVLDLILFSENIDFSPFVGNTDSRWQRFSIVSGDDGNVLPDAQYRDTSQGYTASCEGYVRSIVGDTSSGHNGVTLKIYYDPNDPDLSELDAFDPTTARFNDQTSTGNQVLADNVYAGFFRLRDISWSNANGPALEGGRDQVTVILYSANVDFSGFAGNQNENWQRFTFTSGTEPNVLPDLLYQP